MSRVLLLAIFACAFLGLNAQKVENVRAAANGEQIIITYDLTGTKPDQRFKVNLFSSHNSFAAPVQQVTGDVGENISAGKDKRIAWNARNEITDFKGNLSFEVRADLITPVVAPVTEPVNPPVTSSQFTFRDLSSAKRGGIMQINWTGGSTTENVKLELLKENVPQQTIMNSRNTGAYSWSVPADTKPGPYQLKITGSSGTGVSPYFAIKHKIPTLVKALPIVVIAGVLAASGGGGGGTKPPIGASDLPTPPDP